MNLDILWISDGQFTGCLMDWKCYLGTCTYMYMCVRSQVQYIGTCTLAPVTNDCLRYLRSKCRSVHRLLACRRVVTVDYLTRAAVLPEKNSFKTSFPCSWNMDEIMFQDENTFLVMINQPWPLKFEFWVVSSWARIKTVYNLSKR